MNFSLHSFDGNIGSKYIEGGKGFWNGIRNQVGILVNGTAVNRIMSK
jgi:hypothetical protein